MRGKIFVVSRERWSSKAMGPITHLCLKRNYVSRSRAKDSTCRVAGQIRCQLYSSGGVSPGEENVLGAKMETGYKALMQFWTHRTGSKNTLSCVPCITCLKQ